MEFWQGILFIVVGGGLVFFGAVLGGALAKLGKDK